VKRAGEKKRRKINNHRKIFENLGELKKVNSRKGGPNKKGKRRRKGRGEFKEWFNTKWLPYWIKTKIQFNM